MAFQFHKINDIRQCWLNTPENKFWVVDYMANENSTLPLSVLWDDLSDDDKFEVLSAYFETLAGDECSSPIAASDMCEVLSGYFSEIWEIIPEVKI